MCVLNIESHVSFSLTIVNGFIMLAYALSSTTAAYNEECAKLRQEPMSRSLQLPY